MFIRVQGQVGDGLHVGQGGGQGWDVVGLELQHVPEVEGGLLAVAVGLEDLAPLKVLGPGILVLRLHLLRPLHQENDTAG